MIIPSAFDMAKHESNFETKIIRASGGIEVNAITAYNGELSFPHKTKLVIPAEIDGQKVTCISNLSVLKSTVGTVYSTDNINEIVIESGIKEISNFAFKHCKNLQSITIPASVQKISDTEIFLGCQSLNIIFKCPRGSYAEEWANRYNATGSPRKLKIVSQSKLSQVLADYQDKLKEEEVSIYER